MQDFLPPLNRGIQVLDRSLFDAVFETWAIRVPALELNSVVTFLENELLNLPRLYNVVSDTKDTKLVLLSLTVQDVSELSQDRQDFIQRFELVKYNFKVTYNYWTTEQILFSVMPDGESETPSSYTSTGHIAHLNLKPEHEPYKGLIAQVILDKNKKIKSVVNKTNVIDNTFRNFQMELLAGEKEMVTELRENECRFRFDFSKVYWNSRLQAEHRRLVGKFKKGDVICDVMAGVGPFSIPAAKKGCKVYANDLNPESFEWLCKNIQLNKLVEGIEPYNLDGREFIKKMTCDVSIRQVDHFIMNLPATAIEFLDAFQGIYKDLPSSVPLPMVHCHCFTRSSDPAQDIQERVTRALGSPTEGIMLDWVRTVAPKKEMYCVSFRLPARVAFQPEMTPSRK
ncbi:Met-10+ like-protein-domain-containing protein [Sporodiniella umbellata]|nr:Met-10+ like-protein-domain-containing protein [Sporodiniella umbellata]